MKIRATLVGLPRGIPAASLKHGDGRRRIDVREGLPRGIPAASLKLRRLRRGAVGHSVFRGEYPRPH